MQQISGPENLSDTTDDIESIPDESIRQYLIRSPRDIDGRAVLANNSFGGVPDQQRVMGDDLKDETEEIVRGFILEKDIINEEHKNEKEQIIESLMKDREELIEKFKKQVMDIETKINRDQKEGARTHDSGIHLSNKGMPIYIRLDNDNSNNVISAEEFLSRLQLEDKYETEKDTLERSFRDERRLLKDRLEYDYSRKLQQETSKFGSVVEDMRRTISDLKYENKKLIGAQEDLNAKNIDLKSKWSNAKLKLESQFRDEKNSLKDGLERKYRNKVEMQRDHYEKILAQMKDELKDASWSMTRKEKEISNALESVKDYEARVREEIGEQMSKEYGVLYKKLRDENERLVEQVDKLEKQRDRLTGRIKELENSTDNKMSILNEFTDRLNSEYEERLKKAVLENESLRTRLNELQIENRTQERALRSYEESTKRLENELASKHGLIKGSEEIKEYLRKEAKEFSDEIDILRREKAELQKTVEDCKSMENALKNKISMKDADTDEVLDRCKILERERLGLERKMSLLGEELQQSLEERDGLRKELKRVDEKSSSLKQLIDNERNERDRLSERFRRDAEEIRRKDNECRMLREKLRNRENEIERELGSDAEKVDQLMEMEALNSKLQTKINGMEEKNGEILRQEREEIQKQFAKEFAKRIQTLRRNYDEATDGLKNEIRFLRSKITELESSLQIKRKEIKERSHFGDQFEENKDDRRIEGNIENTLKSDERIRNRNISDPSSGFRFYDNAMNHESNNKTNENKTYTPAAAHSPTRPKENDLQPSRRVVQGAFSRQRSRSLETGNRAQIDHATVQQSQSYGGDRKIVDEFEDLPNHSYCVYINGPLPSEREPKNLLNRQNFSQKSNAFSEDEIIDSKDFDLDRSREYPSHHSQLDHKSLSGLPPKYKPNTKRPIQASTTEYGGKSEAGLDTRRLEKSVEKLQERFETSHNELLQRLEHMQNANHSYEYGSYEMPIRKIDGFYLEAPEQCFGSKDVSQPPDTVPKRGMSNHEKRKQIDLLQHEKLLVDVMLLEEEKKKAKEYANELEIQLKEKTLEANDTTEALRQIYYNQLQTNERCCCKGIDSKAVTQIQYERVSPSAGHFSAKKKIVKLGADKDNENKKRGNQGTYPKNGSEDIHGMWERGGQWHKSAGQLGAKISVVKPGVEKDKESRGLSQHGPYPKIGSDDIEEGGWTNSTKGVFSAKETSLKLATEKAWQKERSNQRSSSKIFMKDNDDTRERFSDEMSV